VTPSTRQAWSQRFADAITEVAQWTNTDVGAWMAIGLLNDMLIDSLEPMQRRVYEWIVENESVVSSEFVATHFRIRGNHAATVLLQLYKLKLLKRTLDTNGNSRQFWYRLNDDSDEVQP